MGEMVEIVLRLPPEALQAALSAALSALREDGGTPAAFQESGAVEEDAAAGSGGFQEALFRRLAREAAEPPGHRKAAGRGEPSRQAAPGEGGPEESTARTPQGFPARRETRSGEEAEPSLPRRGEGDAPERARPSARRDYGVSGEAEPPARRRYGVSEETGAPARRDYGVPGGAEPPARLAFGEAGRPLSAPEPASYAAKRPGESRRQSGEAAAGGETAPPSPPGPSQEGPSQEAMTPEGLSRRWERDSRRYDGAFTLY